MRKSSRRSEPNPASSSRPRLLLVGEGPHDVGRDEPGERGGALAGFLHAVVAGPGGPRHEPEWPFEVVSVRRWVHVTIPLHRAAPKRPRFEDVVRLTADGQRARGAILLAHTLGLDGVVIMRDCERRGRHGLGAELRDARVEYRRLESGTTPSCVIATPSRAHETWLLADPQAVEQALENSACYPFSEDPEDRPDADTLKRHLRFHADRVGCAEYEARKELAFRGRPDAIAGRCRRHYPPFRADVECELRRGITD